MLSLDGGSLRYSSTAFSSSCLDRGENTGGGMVRVRVRVRVRVNVRVPCYYVQRLGW